MKKGRAVPAVPKVAVVVDKGIKPRDSGLHSAMARESTIEK
jgi:hypothetical protein